MALLVLATSVGCRASGATADDGGIRVVASFYPLAEAVRRLGGGCVRVTDLTPLGIEPHDLELSTDVLEAIATADLVVYLGGGFQPALEDGLPEASGDVLDVRRGRSLLEAGDGTVDPHLWLDPSRYAAMTEAIAEGLRSVGLPAGCDLAARAAGHRDRLSLLDAEFATGLADCERDLMVTSHAAFGYLAQAYGLRQEAIAGLEPEAQPDARRIAELRELAIREGVTTIFTEELVAPDVARTLAREVGARTAVLSTVESAPAAGDYLAAMRGNLSVLREGLGCA